MLWCDKYRPSTLLEVDYNFELSQKLIELVKADDFPHLFFYGQSGCGKKTRVFALLRELFGSRNAIDQIKLQVKSFQVPNKTTKVEIAVLSSLCHIELTPSDAGYQDRFVIQEIIKQIAETTPLCLNKQQKHYKIIVINEVDKLSKAAQQALRRTMELYIETCRLILVGNSLSKVIVPIQSRCLLIRVPSPSNDQIRSVLYKVAKCENIDLDPEFVTKVILQSQHNLRRALLCLEASVPCSKDKQPEKAQWEKLITSASNSMINNQNSNCLASCRQIFYDLISHCISPDFIIKHLTLELLTKIDSDLKSEVVYWSAFYEHRIQIGNKSIINLEAFVAKFLLIYSSFLKSITSMDLSQN